MLYVPFLAEKKIFKKNHNKGTINVLQGGGRGHVKLKRQ